MKKILVSALVLISLLNTSNVNAQTKGLYKNTLKVGLSGGASVPQRNSVANLGADVAYQYLVTKHVGIGVATGYNHFFGRNNAVGGTDLKNNDVGMIPIAAAIKYYPKYKGIFVGADAGVGVLTGDEKVASNAYVTRPDAGFYFKPQIGYHNRNWNVFAHYTKLFTDKNSDVMISNEKQKYSIGSLGVGFAYNIGLGYGKKK